MISSPPQGEKPIGAAQQEPAFEREAREIISTTPAELISAHPVVRMATSAVEPLMVAGDMLVGNKPERTKQLKDMQERGAKALGFGTVEKAGQDVSGALLGPLGVGTMKAVPAAQTALGRITQAGGMGGLAGLLTPGDDTGRNVGVGTAAGTGIGAAIEGLLKAPGALGKVLGGLGRFLGVSSPKPKPAAPTTAGAEKAVGELQAQRDVLEGAPAREGKAASEFERASKDFGERMTPLREEAFQGAAVDAKGTMDVIAGLKKANPDAKVRAALKEVRETLDRAIKSSQEASLPAPGTRMSIEQLKAMQGEGGKVSMPMLDEVRQSINRMISQKGDNALDAHTQKVLAQVRDDLVGKSPEQYKRYLQQFAEGRKALDPYQPDASVIGKVTGERGGAPVLGQDAQLSMESVFRGKQPERDLAQLVRDTKHNPEALNGVRESLRKWIMPTEQNGRVNITTGAHNWAKSKQAIQNSGLFEPQHYAAIDTVMTKLSNAERGTAGLKETTAGVAAMIGTLVGRPGTFGMAARNVTGLLTGTEKTATQVEAMIQRVMTDAEFARLAAASPTKANIEAVQRALGAATGGAAANRDQPRKRRADPLSMRPGGL